MELAVFVMPSLVGNFNNLEFKVTRAPLEHYDVCDRKSRDLRWSTESFRLLSSSKFAGELEEVFFNYFFSPLQTKQVIVVYNVGMCLF